MKIFFKVIIFIAILIICFFFIFNFLFSTENLFKHNIINPIPQSITDIKSYKDKSAMHGAIIFKFSANKNDAEKIIKINELLKFEKTPDEINYVLNRFNDIEWWKSSTELGEMKIYGRLIKNEYDWSALFIFVDDTNIKYIVKI